MPTGKKLTQEEAIIHFLNVHGDKYDYCEFIYVRSSKKSTVICHEKDENNIEHGKWQVTHNDHRHGCGCPKCGRIKSDKSRKLTQNYALEQMVKIHGNKYDYSEFVYEHALKTSIIICHKKDENDIEHGKWLCTFANHQSGKGCRKCATEINSKKKSLTQEQAISRMKEIWDKKDPGHYSYNNFVYEGSKKKSLITCHLLDASREHGDFLLDFSHHIRPENPQGCPKCNKDIKLTNEDIDIRLKEQGRHLEIKRIGNVNGNDVSIEWKCLNIDCDNHWFASPNSVTGHIRSNCPKCSSSKMQKETERILKKFNIVFESEKRFLACKNKKTLPFDIWIKDLNVLIELDGIQHYKPVQYPGMTQQQAEEQFINTKFNDNIKNEYCKNNNIKLIRIPYLERKNLDKIIKDILKAYR